MSSLAVRRVLFKGGVAPSSEAELADLQRASEVPIEELLREYNLVGARNDSDEEVEEESLSVLEETASCVRTFGVTRAVEDETETELDEA